MYASMVRLSALVVKLSGKHMRKRSRLQTLEWVYALAAEVLIAIAGGITLFYEKAISGETTTAAAWNALCVVAVLFVASEFGARLAQRLWTFAADRIAIDFNPSSNVHRKSEWLHRSTFLIQNKSRAVPLVGVQVRVVQIAPLVFYGDREVTTEQAKDFRSLILRMENADESGKANIAKGDAEKVFFVEYRNIPENSHPLLAFLSYGDQKICSMLACQALITVRITADNARTVERRFWVDGNPTVGLTVQDVTAGWGSATPAMPDF